MIGPTHRPLPDNTQQTQGTYIHAPAEFEPAILGSERPQNHVLDRAVTVIGNLTIPQRCIWRFRFSRTWLRVVGWVGVVTCSSSSRPLKWRNFVPSQSHQPLTQTLSHIPGNVIPFHVLFVCGALLTFFFFFFFGGKKTLIFFFSRVFFILKKFPL